MPHTLRKVNEILHGIKPRALRKPNKHFQFPLEICVYGKALLQRHLAITCTSLRE